MRSFASSCATFFALLVLCLTFLGCGGKTGQAKLPGAPKAGDKMVVNVRGAKLTFRYCPPGEFTMGSPENEEYRDDDET